MRFYRMVAASSLLLLLGLAAKSAMPHRLSAQQTRRDAEVRAPFTVALVPTTGATNAAWVIVRRPETEPHDVILLDASAANAQHLTEAFVNLMIARRKDGVTPGHRLVLHAGPSHAAKPVRWSAGVISSLKAAQPSAIAGVGTYPNVSVTR